MPGRRERPGSLAPSVRSKRACPRGEGLPERDGQGGPPPQGVGEWFREHAPRRNAPRVQGRALGRVVDAIPWFREGSTPEGITTLGAAFEDPWEVLRDEPDRIEGSRRETDEGPRSGEGRHRSALRDAGGSG